MPTLKNNPMLSPDDIKKIHAEERLRHEIRQQLQESTQPTPPKTEEQPTLATRLMEFFNSSLGMWLLSSVLLTGGAATYQQIEHSFQVHQQNHQQLMTHLFEIQNRIDNMSYLLKSAKTVGDAQRGLAGLFKSTFPLSPDLQNRSLGSLYLSVYNLIPGTRQQKAKEAIEFVRQLEDSEYSFESRPKDQPLTDADRVQLNNLIKATKETHISLVDLQQMK